MNYPYQKPLVKYSEVTNPPPRPHRLWGLVWILAGAALAYLVGPFSPISGAFKAAPLLIVIAPVIFAAFLLLARNRT